MGAGLEMLTMMSFGETPPADTRGLPLHKGPWYSWRAPILFTMIPVATFIVTYGVSLLERIWERVNLICSKLEDAEKGEANQDAEEMKPTKTAESYIWPGHAVSEKQAVEIHI